MNEEQLNSAKRIRHAIDRTMEGLKWAHEKGARGVWEGHMRHLARLQDLEYAILSMVKVEASTPEGE